MTANKVLTNAGPIISLHVEKSTAIYKRHLLTGDRSTCIQAARA